MKEIFIAAVPSAFFSIVTAIIIYYFKRNQDKKDKERKKRDDALMEFVIKDVNGTMAAISMCEAIGNAVARIPDAHCNGDMHKAVKYGTEVKHNMREFLTEQGVHYIFDE